MESFTPEKHKAIQNHENKLLVLLAMEEKYANNYYKEKIKLCSVWKELSVSVKKKKNCNIPVPKHDTVCCIKPASVNQASQKNKN